MAKNASTDLKHWFDAEQQSNDWGASFSNLKRVIAEIARERRLLAIGVLVLLVSTASAIIEPRVLGHFVDHVLVPKRFERLAFWVAFYFGLQVVRVVTVYFYSMVFAHLGLNVMQRLRLQVISKLLSLPVSQFHGQPVGRLVTRVTGDVAALSDMFSAGFITIFGNVIFVLGTLVGLLILNVKLGLMTVALMPFLVLATQFYSTRLHKSYRHSRSRLSALNAFLAETILGMRVIQLCSRESVQKERYEILNGSYTQALIGTVRVFAVFQPVITVFAGLATALAIVFGMQEVMSGTIAVGVLVAFFSYVQALFQPIRELADKWTVVLSGLASSERIFEILDQASEQNKSAEPRALDETPEPYRFKGHIRFENVWFAYSGENWVLKDFSGEIFPGEQIGLVGHTGAGKSTLVQLLMRFYEPNRGRIWVDGKDIREYDLGRYRRALGLVSQDVMLFSGSIRDNVTLWDEKSSSFDLESRMAFISDRQIGERGYNLSAGERQWVAFHRAAYLNPSIWILDEATANIDAGTETELEKWFRTGSQDHTALLVAHRLSTLRNADSIWVFEHGVCVERGSHTELKKKGGAYAEFLRYQALSESLGSQCVN